MGWLVWLGWKVFRLADGLALSDGLSDGLAGACEPGWILQLRLGIRSQLRL